MTLSGGQIITDFLQMTKLVSCVTLSYTCISGGTNNLAYSRDNCISYIRRLRYSPSLDHLGQFLSHVLKAFLLCQSHFFPSCLSNERILLIKIAKSSAYFSRLNGKLHYRIVHQTPDILQPVRMCHKGRVMIGMSNFIHVKESGVLIRLCFNFNGGLVKPPLKLGHRQVIATHMNPWIWLFFYIIIFFLAWVKPR